MGRYSKHKVLQDCLKAERKPVILQARKVPLSILDAIVLAALGIIPFDAEPDALGTIDRTDESNGPQRAGMTQAGARSRQDRCHVHRLYVECDLWQLEI